MTTTCSTMIITFVLGIITGQSLGVLINNTDHHLATDEEVPALLDNLREKHGPDANVLVRRVWDIQVEQTNKSKSNSSGWEEGGGKMVNSSSDSQESPAARDSSAPFNKTSFKNFTVNLTDSFAMSDRLKDIFDADTNENSSSNVEISDNNYNDDDGNAISFNVSDDLESNSILNSTDSSTLLPGINNLFNKSLDFPLVSTSQDDFSLGGKMIDIDSSAESLNDDIDDTSENINNMDDFVLSNEIEKLKLSNKRLHECLLKLQEGEDVNCSSASLKEEVEAPSKRNKISSNIKDIKVSATESSTGAETAESATKTTDFETTADHSIQKTEEASISGEGNATTNDSESTTISTNDPSTKETISSTTDVTTAETNVSVVSTVSTNVPSTEEKTISSISSETSTESHDYSVTRVSINIPFTEENATLSESDKENKDTEVTIVSTNATSTENTRINKSDEKTAISAESNTESYSTPDEMETTTIFSSTTSDTDHNKESTTISTNDPSTTETIKSLSSTEKTTIVNDSEITAISTDDMSSKKSTIKYSTNGATMSTVNELESTTSPSDHSTRTIMSKSSTTTEIYVTTNDVKSTRVSTNTPLSTTKSSNSAKSTTTSYSKILLESNETATKSPVYSNGTTPTDIAPSTAPINLLSKSRTTTSKSLKKNTKKISASTVSPPTLATKTARTPNSNASSTLKGNQTKKSSNKPISPLSNNSNTTMMLSKIKYALTDIVERASKKGTSNVTSVLRSTTPTNSTDTDANITTYFENLVKYLKMENSVEKGDKNASISQPIPASEHQLDMDNIREKNNNIDYQLFDILLNIDSDNAMVSSKKTNESPLEIKHLDGRKNKKKIKKNHSSDVKLENKPMDQDYDLQYYNSENGDLDPEYGSELDEYDNKLSSTGHSDVKKTVPYWKPTEIAKSPDNTMAIRKKMNKSPLEIKHLDRDKTGVSKRTFNSFIKRKNNKKGKKNISSDLKLENKPMDQDYDLQYYNSENGDLDPEYGSELDEHDNKLSSTGHSDVKKPVPNWKAPKTPLIFSDYTADKENLTNSELIKVLLSKLAAYIRDASNVHPKKRLGKLQRKLIQPKFALPKSTAPPIKTPKVLEPLEPVGVIRLRYFVFTEPPRQETRRRRKT